MSDASGDGVSLLPISSVPSGSSSSDSRVCHLPAKVRLSLNSNNLTCLASAFVEMYPHSTRREKTRGETLRRRRQLVTDHRQRNEGGGERLVSLQRNRVVSALICVCTSETKCFGGVTTSVKRRHETIFWSEEERGEKLLCSLVPVQKLPKYSFEYLFKPAILS